MGRLLQARRRICGAFSTHMMVAHMPCGRSRKVCFCVCVCVHSLSLHTHTHTHVRTLTGRTVRRPSTQSKSSQAAMSIDLWAKQTRSLKAPSLPEFSEVFLQERNIYIYVYATGSYASLRLVAMCVICEYVYFSATHARNLSAGAQPHLTPSSRRRQGIDIHVNIFTYIIHIYIYIYKGPWRARQPFLQ